MDIYIEFVIIDNLVMDYIIINFMEMTIGRKFGRWNKVVLLILGCCFALLLPLLVQHKVLSLVYRFITAMLLVICLKRYRTIREFLLYYFMFFAYTFFVGGLCFGLIQMLGIDYTMSSVVMYEFDFPFGLFALIMLVVIRLMKRTVMAIKNRLKTSSYIRKIKVVDSDNMVEGYGLLDSGNAIKYDGVSVSIISVDLFLKLYRNIKLQDLFLSKTLIEFQLNKCEYIDIVGIGKKEKYLSFVPEYIVIGDRKIDSPRLAVSMKSFGSYDIVLSNEYIGGEL